MINICKVALFIYMRKNYSQLVSQKLDENHSLIQTYINKNTKRKSTPELLIEELKGELTLYLLEPFTNSSMEKSIKLSTLQKRKNKVIKIINKNDNSEFLKYCYGWINKNIAWTNHNFYRKSTLIPTIEDDYLLFDNEDDYIETNFERNIREYQDIIDNNYEITAENELRLLLLEKILKKLPNNEQYLYKLSFRDGLKKEEVGRRLNVSPITAYLWTRKLKEKLRCMVNDMMIENIN